MPSLSISRARKHFLDYDIAKAEVVVGRDPAADVVLDHDAVSRRHLLIRQHPRGWIVEDTSRNGLFINGENVAKKALREGDTIEVAQFVLIYSERALPKSEAQVLQEQALQSTGSDSYDLALTPTAAAQAATVEAGGNVRAPTSETKGMSLKDMQWLVDAVARRRMAHVAFVSDKGRQEFVLEGDEHLIGWGDDCDIRLPGKKLFGKAAAVIFRTPAGHQLESQSKLNPVRVGGEKVKHHILREGDVFEVGGLSVRYHAAVD